MTENVKLNDGRKIPPIGMGTYKVNILPMYYCTIFALIIIVQKYLTERTDAIPYSNIVKTFLLINRWLIYPK